MSRRRKHHYMYMKAGGVILAVHYRVWSIIAIVVAALGVWLYIKDRALLTALVIVALVVIGFIVIGLSVFIVRHFRYQESSPEYSHDFVCKHPNPSHQPGDTTGTIPITQAQARVWYEER